MAKTKVKAWLVTLVPPKGATPRLKARNSGEERTPIRNYHLQAASRGEAQSLIEHQERLAAEQAVDALLFEADPKQLWEEPKRQAFREAKRAKIKPWVVDKVTAA